jgi:hypothetical protein
VVDIDALKQDWVGKEFHRAEYPIDLQRVLDYANACSDPDPRFIDPSHPDFQAHPLFVGCLGNSPGNFQPRGFPDLGKGRGIDGGKSVEVLAAVRPGDVLTGHNSIADIYAKTGRSGTMVFIVHRMTLNNQHGEHVATVDLRQIKAVEG